MTQPPHDEPTAAGPEELREQVERTRRHLGDTVEERAGRTDVKARAQEKAAAKASELSGQARATADRAGRMWRDKDPRPVRDNRTALITAAAALLVAGALLSRRKQ